MRVIEWGFVIAGEYYPMPLTDEIKRCLETIVELEYAYGSDSWEKIEEIWELVAKSVGIEFEFAPPDCVRITKGHLVGQVGYLVYPKIINTMNYIV